MSRLLKQYVEGCSQCVQNARLHLPRKGVFNIFQLLHVLLKRVLGKRIREDFIHKVGTVLFSYIWFINCEGYLYFNILLTNVSNFRRAFSSPKFSLYFSFHICSLVSSRKFKNESSHCQFSEFIFVENLFICLGEILSWRMPEFSWAECC